MGIEDEIEAAREKLQETPVNKATETERARLKAKIAQLEEEQEKRQAETGSSTQGYAVEKTGDATVALVGYPSVGKSTLLNQLTNAESEVGEYEFTTLDVVPGILQHRGAHIQLLDVPGLIGGAADDKGGGQQVLSVIRNADMVVLMADPDRLDGFDRMDEELYDAGIRTNMEPPNIKVTKKDKGGIDVKAPIDLTQIDRDTLEDVMEQWGYVNATIVIREDVGIDRVIDALATNRVYMPALKVVNKADQIDKDTKIEIEDEYDDPIFISAEHGTNLETLKDAIFEHLGLIRVYLKQKSNTEADKEEPMIMEEGDSVETLCEQLHDTFLDRFKHARVWGESAKHPGQRVGLDHTIQDEDTIEITKQ
ncbi:MAG: GTP-binding protein [Candidatus Nanohaloarchaeota archaeon QJJ-5]|nr:GTP-binding protein [Candidatus Nanohaloarchaeota archaeon QJJ-5]